MTKLNLKTINAHFPEHRAARSADAVDCLETEIAAGRVPNASFVKSKEAINHAVSDAVQEFSRRHGQSMQFDVLVLGAYHLPAAHKEAVRACAGGRAGFLADLLPLHELLQSAKPLIVKRSDGAASGTIAAPKRGAMTCQVCGRLIFAATGSIAHHGYRRPWGGGQTSSCEGAMCAPFEANRSRLGRLIEELRADVAASLRILEDVDAERSPVLVSVADRTMPLGSDGRRPTRKVPVTRVTFEEAKARGDVDFLVASFDALKTSHVRGHRHAIEKLQAEIDVQTQRFEGWVPTHRWESERGAWSPLVGAA
ncbi:hypothetical protein XI06_20175 [Bradyrhizobium sp. CCBAU 11434]|uniref:hypothetical protein n=1 Tax=Bradyrhizobium sp. CCBAU 11434 TaxID=1630885 RepID=UPI002306A2A2|nr:hypothetical protein [Bradyrhizobium sp. CCBAU 11434]MDA9522537.1 hypothetical protein [Bradyrhizobium sp. CCBAU 11434]